MDIKSLKSLAAKENKVADKTEDNDSSDDNNYGKSASLRYQIK